MTVPITGLEPSRRRLVLHGLVQHRVEVLAFLAERHQTESGQGAVQLVGYRLQRAGLQVAVLARPLEIVEHAQQLADDAGLGPVGRGLLVAQRALAVVGEVGLDPLQVTQQFGGLAGLLGTFARKVPGRTPSRRPSLLGTGRGMPHFTRFRIDPPLVGDGYLLLWIAIRFLISVRHLDSRSSSTTSASTTSSAEPEEAPGSPPSCGPAAWVAS